MNKSQPAVCERVCEVQASLTSTSVNKSRVRELREENVKKNNQNKNPINPKSCCCNPQSPELWWQVKSGPAAAAFSGESHTYLARSLCLYTSLYVSPPSLTLAAAAAGESERVPRAQDWPTSGTPNLLRIFFHFFQFISARVTAAGGESRPSTCFM